jgi:hypothetical protein
MDSTYGDRHGRERPALVGNRQGLDFDEEIRVG